MTDFIKKYHLDRTTWTYKGFHGVLHTFFAVAADVFSMSEYFGFAPRQTLFIAKDDFVWWYWPDLDLNKIREMFFSRLRRNPRYLEKIKKLWVKKLKLFDAILAKIDHITLESLSDNGLWALYRQFYAAYQQEFGHFMALGDAISMYTDLYLVPEFQSALGSKFDTVFPHLVATKYYSFLESEARDRQKLLRAYRARSPRLAKLLERHARKYFYISNNYAKAFRLTAKDFLQMIQSDSKRRHKQVRPSKQAVLNRRKRLIKKYHLNSRQKQMLYVLDEFFGIQDTRKKYVLIANYYQFVFLKELARRTRHNFADLQYSVFPEFPRFLKGGIKAAILRRRRAGVACLCTPRHYELATGSTAKKILNFLQRQSAPVKLLKGFVASRGQARGRVKIILKTHDLISMARGDILVTSMTRPEMISGLKKAAAVVTDEGGITSHAAIVSRELGIPCIIGTKFATQVLKDGDMVEVDANKGVVRKI